MEIYFAVGEYTNYGLGVELDTMKYFKNEIQAIEYYNKVCANAPDKYALYTIKDNFITKMGRYAYITEDVSIGPITPIFKGE